jgi:hypothetical protein
MGSGPKEDQSSQMTSWALTRISPLYLGQRCDVSIALINPLRPEHEEEDEVWVGGLDRPYFKGEGTEMSLLWSYPGSRDSDWLRAGRPRGRSSSPGRSKNFLSSMWFWPFLGSTQPSIQWVPGALSLEEKRRKIGFRLQTWKVRQDTNQHRKLWSLIAGFAYSSKLNVEKVCSSETSVNIYQITRRHTPEDS